MRAAEVKCDGLLGAGAVPPRRAQLRQRRDPEARVGDPALGLRRVARPRQAQQVEAALGVIEGEHPVGKQKGGVGQRRVVRVGAAALCLQLVAEVADEAAVKVEGKLIAGLAQAGDLAAEVVEDRLPDHFAGGAPLDAQRACADVVCEDSRQRAVRVAHEGEATLLTGNAAVKPEGGLAVAEQLGEGRLRVVDPRESLHLQLELRAAGHAIARHARDDTAPAGPAVRANRPSLGVELAGEVAEVGEQPAAVLGADRLRMELDAPQRALAVGDGHEHAVARARQRLQPPRERLAHAQRVVANGAEFARDPGEQLRAVVQNGAEAPVHHLGRVHDLRAFNPADALVPEAHSQQRDVRAVYHLRAETEVARVIGSPWTGRDDDVVEAEALQLAPVHRIVAEHDRLLAVDLRQQLEEVVGEGVVVVDQQALQRRQDGTMRGWRISPGPTALRGCSRRSSWSRGRRSSSTRICGACARASTSCSASSLRRSRAKRCSQRQPHCRWAACA